MMIIVNSRLLHQLHSLSPTPLIYMRQRIASDTTFADFKWNDQIDDFIVFTLAISIIILMQLQ
jgi:hypothetical protein